MLVQAQGYYGMQLKVSYGATPHGFAIIYVKPDPSDYKLFK